MDKKQYAWSFVADSNDYNRKDTVEECLKEARKDNFRNEKVVYIGEVVEYDAEIDTEEVIESTSWDAYEFAGEIAESWLTHIPAEQTSELDKELNEIFKNWLKKHKLEPSFYKVDEIKKYNLETGKIIKPLK